MDPHLCPSNVDSLTRMVRTKSTTKKTKSSSRACPSPSIKKAQSAQSKHWVFTLNNPTDDDHFDTSLSTYCIIGNEVSESGTPHYQGYVCMKRRYRLSAMKKLMPRAHLEIMSKKSNPKAASTYCKKDGEFKEFGTLPLTGSEVTKNKWDSAYDSAKNGNFEEIPKDMLVRYYHSFKRIRQDHPDKPATLDETCGIWYVGVTGCGKSKTAREKYPDFYDKPLNKWWDGYRNEPYVILDDVGPDQGQWMGSLMKRWTDHYPFPAEQKGTTVQIRPKNIIVTSQYTIREVFCSDTLLQEALERRFTVIEM